MSFRSFFVIPAKAGILYLLSHTSPLFQNSVGSDKIPTVIPAQAGIQCNIRRYRLMVRTDGSHPSNRGSIPRTATNKKS